MRRRLRDGAASRSRPAPAARTAADEAQPVKLVPPIEKVSLTKLTATDGRAYVGVGLEYHTTGGEATRLEFGLGLGDAAVLGAQLSQLAEKLRATEH